MLKLLDPPYGIRYITKVVVMEFYGNLVKTQKLTEVKHERR